RTLGVETAVDDQIALMDHLGLEKALVGGWSMGVQVTLELYRRHPERVLGMILLNGTYGRIFSTAFRTPLSGYLLPPTLRAMRKIAPLAGVAIKGFARWRGTIPLASRLKLVNRNIDREVFRRVASEFGDLDLDLYFESLVRLADHDAEDVLPLVDVPVLIIAAEHDLMTPPEVTRKMVEEMKHAELMVVPGGSHYCLLEYPDRVSARVRRFLEEHFPHALGGGEEAMAGG
ncbi:MAG: alpha/beta fold hydrolase, partial [Myxococcota bacterium]